ncbi:MAG: 5'/3'-nucleotidase SurE [Chloroflexi bacterium RBG_16_48_8]|nr:MAG: 5'/3'-nucleotidase SurE [Chloroflexi bacterium RBG_16_48_8]
MNNVKPQILLTNDDGIQSPGLWSAAEALSSLGFVTVVAPREQQSGSGRSMPSTSDGVIREEEVEVRGKRWKVYAVGGTPAQAVQHAVLELMPGIPDLVVSGINYGENIGSGVTISGTVGAALEGAAIGAPSMAVSLEVDLSHHLSHSKEIDFGAAAHFTCVFARQLLKGPRLADVDVLKIDVPCDATADTPWKITRLSRVQYFLPVKPERADFAEAVQLGYRRMEEEECLDPGTDSHALRKERVVAVTPISLDLTSRTDFTQLDQILRNDHHRSHPWG